ncbi:VWA domain-containing protein [Bacillus sp. CLL-7-23]|uniref:VWA domain-containing protein n=1 Tax=Bacillus changyiensis TaxID=3004103 RepID=A0ABT4X546_9BACI|nr:VWA domain-containing protein [Bacillus changyiensis]MDA7026849.1 VWA domain-containing protein [Bacillus changyiensis]
MLCSCYEKDYRGSYFDQNQKKKKPSLFKRLILGNKAEKPTPTLVFFITDGDNLDQGETRNIVYASSKLPIFWQFVGIGDQDFTFLKNWTR